MKAVTVRLPLELHRKLAAEARASSRSLGAVIRDMLEAQTATGTGTVHRRAGDFAGVLTGSRRAATNRRRKFKRR